MRNTTVADLEKNLKEPKFAISKEHYLAWRWLNLFGSLQPPASNGSRVYPVFLARNAIFHGLTVLRLQHGDRVLVPAYICSVVPESIIAYGAEVDFYDICHDFRINIEQCEDQIGPRTRAVLAVHYFGFPTPLEELKDLCTRRGLYLIEDCAHVLLGEAAGTLLGSMGDIAVFSLRKFLPLYDGGVLLLNNPQLKFSPNWSEESFLFTLKVAKNMFDVAMECSAPPVVNSLLNMAQNVRSLLYKIAQTSQEQAQVLSASVNSSHFDKSLVNLPMSRLSIWVASRSAINRIVEARRNNYLRLLSGLHTIDAYYPRHSYLPPSVCPWVLPLSMGRVRDVQLEFRKRGIPASHWGGVRFPGIIRDAYPVADELYDGIIFLPVHQNLTLKQVDAILDIAWLVAKDAA